MAERAYRRRLGADRHERPSAHRSSAPHERVPLAVLVRADGGTARRGLLHLQRSAGNRAVAASLARRPSQPTVLPPTPTPSPASPSAIAAAAASHAGVHVVGSPAPTEKPATDGIRQIKALPLGGNAIGYTRLPFIRPLRLRTAEPKQIEGGWIAPLEPTSVQADGHSSLYPGPGAHELRAEGEQKVHGYLSEKVSGIVREGEMEHLLDLEWARHLTYDTAAETVNALAAAEPPVADSPDAARALACQQLRAALPAQLRWADGQSPNAKLEAVYGSLEQVTHSRDRGWHNVPDETIRAPHVEADMKERLGIPKEDRLREFNHRGEIGKHPPEVIVPARFAKL